MSRLSLKLNSFVLLCDKTNLKIDSFANKRVLSMRYARTGEDRKTDISVLTCHMKKN